MLLSVLHIIKESQGLRQARAYAECPRRFVELGLAHAGGVQSRSLDKTLTQTSWELIERELFYLPI